MLVNLPRLNEEHADISHTTGSGQVQHIISIIIANGNVCPGIYEQLAYSRSATGSSHAESRVVFITLGIDIGSKLQDLLYIIVLEGVDQGGVEVPGNFENKS